MYTVCAASLQKLILIYEKELMKCTIILAILNTVIACVFDAGRWRVLSCRQPDVEDRTC